MKDYIDKDIKRVWSFNKYFNHYKDVDWQWRCLPFSNDINKIDSFQFEVNKDYKNISILEVGSSMGQSYKFLKEQNNIDTSQYTGIDVSKTAYDHCCKIHPEARWINENFAEYNLNEKFDYSYERHSVHHMPRPLEQFEKILRNTNQAFTTTFRGCVYGPTISNLEVGYFENETGRYFMNIINFLEVIKIGIKYNFNNLRVDFRGLHEKIPSHLDSDGMVLSEKVDRKKILLSRFIISFRKDKINKNLKINLIKKKIYSPKNFFIIRKIQKELNSLV